MKIRSSMLSSSKVIINVQVCYYDLFIFKVGQSSWSYTVKPVYNGHSKIDKIKL